MISRMDGHLPVRWLLDHHDGTLAPQRAAEAEAHLATGCALCAERAKTVRRLVAAITAGTPEAPPPALDRRVRALYDTHRAPQRDVLQFALVADVAPEAAFALRSAADGPRRVLWRVGAYEIDAMVTVHDGRADLLGQVVAEGGACVAGLVRAVRGVRVLAWSAVAEDGRFTFRGLTPGPVALEGTLDGRSFALPLLALVA